MWLEVGVGMAALFAVVPALRRLVLFLFFAAGIFLEEQLSRRGCCPRLRFPRSPAEIRRAALRAGSSDIGARQEDGGSA